MTQDPADFIQTRGPEALTALLAGAVDLQAHLAGRVLLAGESPGPAVLARAEFELTGPAELHAAAAYFLCLAGRTRAMLRQEAEDRGAPLEREALAWLARHPEDAPEDAEEIFTGAARLLLAVSIQRSAGRGWPAIEEAAAQALEREPLIRLPGEARRALVDELSGELDACRSIRRPSRRAVERLSSGVDVRARRVEAILVRVIEAIAAGEPLLDTGERLRAALRAWEAAPT